MTPKCLAALAVVSLFVSAAAAIEVDFDQPTDLTSFSFEAQYSHTPFVWNASAGVGGGGGLTVTGSHAATYMPDAYDFRTPGAALNASAMFRAKDPGVIQPGSSVTYGNVYVVREPNEHGTFFADSLESSVRESADEIELAGGDFGVGGQGSGWSVPFPKGLVQPGRWYQIAAEIRNVGTGLFDWTVQLNDYGPTGQQLVVVRRIPGVVANGQRRRQLRRVAHDAADRDDDANDSADVRRRVAAGDHDDDAHRRGRGHPPRLQRHGREFGGDHGISARRLAGGCTGAWCAAGHQPQRDGG
jgi:hypothetical protein